MYYDPLKVRTQSELSKIHIELCNSLNIPVIEGTAGRFIFDGERREKCQ